jgi:hypothetical protein
MVINKYLKLFLFVVLLGLSGYQFWDEEIGNGLLVLFLALLVLLFYFKNGLLIRAFLKLRKQNFTGAEKLLLKVKKPGRCFTKKQQGYYNYLLGIISSQTNMLASEKFFKKAVSFGLSMKHDMAMAKLNLASIALSKRRKREATNLINEATKLDKRKLLASQIKMIKAQLKRI